MASKRLRKTFSALGKRAKKLVGSTGVKNLAKVGLGVLLEKGYQGVKKIAKKYKETQQDLKDYRKIKDRAKEPTQDLPEPVNFEEESGTGSVLSKIPGWVKWAGVGVLGVISIGIGFWVLTRKAKKAA